MDEILDSARLIVERFRDQLDPVMKVKVEPEEMVTFFYRDSPHVYSLILL